MEGERVKVVDFSDGFCGIAKAEHNCFIRLVSTRRLQQSWRRGEPACLRYQVKEQVVLDRKSGLVWSKDVVNTRPYTFDELISFIENRRVA